IDALADGGVRAVIPMEDSVRLAAQTVLGADAMVLETGEHPAVLKDNVTSLSIQTVASGNPAQVTGACRCQRYAVSWCAQR
ncbi:MAG: pyrroline-5-carboxylate reductase, partial [Chloroflexales bacterium]|nr:pyrroline-5-carboxylate reductase [Chloroflexales bacterium]